MTSYFEFQSRFPVSSSLKVLPLPRASYSFFKPIAACRARRPWLLPLFSCVAARARARARASASASAGAQTHMLGDGDSGTMAGRIFRKCAVVADTFNPKTTALRTVL